MPNKYIFSEETVRSLQELGEVLRRISDRLMSEGWTKKDGEYIPPPGYQPKKVRPLKRK
jgi:hypothetical protein